MAIYVKIVNGQVTQVVENIPSWDVGNPQWKNAIEIRPAINPRDEYYGSHYFDLLKDPVEIIWPVQTLTVEEKRNMLFTRMNSLKSFLIERNVSRIEFVPTNITAVSTVIEYIDSKMPLLSTLNTHNKVNKGIELYEDLRTKIDALTSTERGQLLYELTSSTVEQGLSAEIAPTVQERITDLLGKISYIKQYAVEKQLQFEKNKSATSYFDFPFLQSLFNDLHTKTSTLTGLTTHNQLNNAYRVYDERMTYLRAMTGAVGAVNW